MIWFLACAVDGTAPVTTPGGNEPPLDGDRTVADADATLHGPVGGGTVRGADLDGDGFGELILGTPESEALPGAVTIATGPPHGEVAGAAVWTGGSAWDHAGYALAIGDLDGNGDADLAIGAFTADDGAVDGGSVYIVPDGAGGSLADAPAVVVDDVAQNQSGVAVGIGGWLGRPTLAVGACLDDTSGADAGGVYLFGLPVSGGVRVADAAALVTGQSPGDAAGSAFGGGDVDGDGADDLLVGSWLADGAGAEDAGAAYVVRGPITGEVSLGDAECTLTGERAGDFAGAPVSLGGDITGDGLPDLLVGAWMNDGSAADGGAVYVTAGTCVGVIALAAAHAIVRGATAGEYLGVVDVGRGDVDGNGWDDLLVGGSGGAGRALLFFGPIAGGTLEPDRRFFGGTSGDGVGIGVSLADLDADGLADVLVGANVGDAYVYYGARL